MSTTIMRSLTFIVFIESKKIAVLVFSTSRHTWPIGLLVQRWSSQTSHIFHVSQKEEKNEKKQDTHFLEKQIKKEQINGGH